MLISHCFNDWKVFFTETQSKGSRAVEVIANHGFLLSIVNAFGLKAKHSLRTHCLRQMFNWNE